MSMPLPDPQRIAQLEARMQGSEADRASLHKAIGQIDGSLDQFREAVNAAMQNMRDELRLALAAIRDEFRKERIEMLDRNERLAKRPSWGVTLALVTLSSVVVALIGAVATLVAQ